MKKLKLLVAPLLVLPFVVGCNNGGGDKPTEVKFSLSSDWPIKVLEDNKTAEVSVDWTPNDIIKFESFTFDATPTKDNTVTFDPTGYPRPMRVTIEFDDYITEDVSGTLSFEYEDVTTKTKGESSINVTIPKPEPADPYFVDEEQFNKAMSFNDVVYAQFNTVEDTEHGMITREDAQFAPNKFHLESHNFTKGEDTYNCDIYVTKEGTDTYKRYQPITDITKYTDPYNCLAYTDDAWKVVTAGVDSTEFKTPKDYVDFSGITYDADSYDPTTHYFEIDGNYFQFRNGKLTIAHNTATSMTVNIDYEEYDIDLPDVTTPISYKVDEDVWAAYKNELSPYSDMSTFFATEEPVTTKNEIKCVYSEDLIYGFLNQSPISNVNTMEEYSFHETSYEEPQDIYYNYLSYNSSPFTRTDYDTKEEWFEISFAGPTQAMIKMIFDFDKSRFQFDATNNCYYADDVDIVKSEETVQCDLKVAFINNQLVYTDALSNDGTTIKEHVDVFAKNSFIEVPEFPKPGLF